MHAEKSLKRIQKEWHGTLKSYVIGFIASILLTMVSFGLVITQVLSGPIFLFAILGLAFVQALFQLLFFLHLGQEAKPRWEMLVFYFMLLVLFIVVIGSLWIMNDLNNRVMPEMAMEHPHD